MGVLNDWISMKKRMEKCDLVSAVADNRAIHRVCEDVSKEAGQLQFGSFTRLRLTLKTVFR